MQNILAIFQTHISTQFQNKLSKTLENLKDTHLCIYSNKNHYKGCLDKASFSKHFQNHTHKTPFQEIEKQRKVVVPQNFPSHILQDLTRIIFKWLKDPQELIRLLIRVQIRVLVLLSIIRLLMPQMIFMVHHRPLIMLMPSFKSHITNLLNQLLR